MNPAVLFLLILDVVIISFAPVSQGIKRLRNKRAELTTTTTTTTIITTTIITTTLTKTTAAAAARKTPVQNVEENE